MIARSPGRWAAGALIVLSLAVIGIYGGIAVAQEDSDAPKKPAEAAKPPEELPDDVTLWRKKEFYQARRTGDPRLRVAVAHLGQYFARSWGSKNEKAGELLTRLLKAGESTGGAGAGSSGPPGSSPSGPPSGYPSGGPPPGYGGRSGGPPPGYGRSGGPSSDDSSSSSSDSAASSAPPPSKPLDSASIAAIVDALVVNGSKTAQKTLREVLAGTFRSDSDRAAAEAAVVAYLAHPSPQGDQVLFVILTTPERIRAIAGEAESSGRSGYSSGYSMSSSSEASRHPPADYNPYRSGAYSGGSMPGSGQASEGPKIPAKELQARTRVFVEHLASEEFRLKLVEYVLNPRTPPEHRTSLMNVLLAVNAKNVAAQTRLHASPLLDQGRKAEVERNFTKYSSDALAMLMGVPFETKLTLAPANRTGSGGSGYSSGSGYSGGGTPPGSSRSGPPPGYSGGPPPGASGGGPPPGYSRSGPPPGYPGSRSESDDDRGSGDAAAGTPNSPIPNAPANIPPGMIEGMPGSPALAAMPGMSGMPAPGMGGLLPGMGAAPPAFRLPEHLWGKSFTDSILAQLDQIESLDQGTPRLLLASTVPTDAMRVKLYQTLFRCREEGPGALEDAGLGTNVFNDPGFLVVMKSLPRKDAPVNAKEVRTRTPRTRTKRGSDRGGGDSGSGASRSGYPPGSGEAQSKPKEPEKPEYIWMEASENLARAMCDQFMAAGKRRVAVARLAPKDPAESRPLELPPNANIVAEYHFDWPGDMGSRGKVSGVPSDAMTVHYVRMQANSTPTKALGYFRRKLARPSEHPSDHGYWLESFRAVPDTDQKESIDVLVAKKEARDVKKPAAKSGTGTSGYGPPPGYGSSDSEDRSGSSGSKRGQPPEKDTQADLVIEILYVNVKNPAAGAEGSEESKPGKPGKKDDVF